MQSIGLDYLVTHMSLVIIYINDYNPLNLIDAHTHESPIVNACRLITGPASTTYKTLGLMAHVTVNTRPINQLSLG